MPGVDGGVLVLGWGPWGLGEGAVNLPHGTKRCAGSVVKLTLELAALTMAMLGQGVPSRHCVAAPGLSQVGTLDFCSSRGPPPGSGGSLCWVRTAGLGGDWGGLGGGWGGGWGAARRLLEGA